MTRQDEILKERQRKIEKLRKKGISAYAYSFDKKNNSAELQERFKELEPEEKTRDEAQIAGRIIAVRDIGGIIFVKLQDQHGKIQIVFQDRESPVKEIEFFKEYIDIGDFIGARGNVFRTKRGELSILAKKIELLAKSILPLPEKWHGLQDKEERYRKRYLDLIMSPQVKEVFVKREVILQAIREFMKKNDFIEVETPILQAVYGGANAKPFKTHCDAFDSDVYLSIAPELYLKRCLVGGFDRVYEITKKFRNEGVDREHNPEHMTIEWYQAYADYEDGMWLFSELMRLIAQRLFGKTSFEYQGNNIDLSKWKRIPLLDAIKEHLKIDISKIKTDQEARKIAYKHGINPANITKINLAEELLKLFRNKLIQPTFLTDYPIEMAPLTKSKRGDETKAEIFQPFVGGLELARAYSELNDPVIQERNFKEQERERKKGNKEAMPLDMDFVDALKYGMPPACGVGIGIERLVMLFTNQSSIRDVILFPFMKKEKG